MNPSEDGPRIVFAFLITNNKSIFNSNKIYKKIKIGFMTIVINYLKHFYSLFINYKIKKKYITIKLRLD